VISGASSGSRQVRRKPFDFPLIGIPHRYYSACVAARRPDDDHDALIEPAGTNEAQLAIVAPIITPREMHTREDLFRPSKVEATLEERLLALGAIKGDPHDIYCSYI
jgi:hypothetical protein